MNSFSVRTKIMEGGGLETLAPKLHKVFIVTDGFMASSGKVSYITEKLDRAGAEYRVFDQVKADPDIGTVTKGVDMIQEFHPDAVIAFGGGSPIDAAKAIVFFAAKTCDMRECMFIAVPTTSGTGSEVSKFAVITDPEKEVKYPLVEDSLLPDVAILDAELTVSVPPSVTADTGIDVFTHAVEAFVSTEATDFSDAAAEKAIKLVKRHLLPAYQNPEDRKARQGMHNASCLAGIAFSNSGLGLNHGMAHALGARFHIPHGRANGILLPYVMSFNAGCAEQLTSTDGICAGPDGCFYVADFSAIRPYFPPAGAGEQQCPPERPQPHSHRPAVHRKAEHALHPPGRGRERGGVRGGGARHGRGGPGRPLHRYEPQKLHGGGN